MHTNRIWRLSEGDNESLLRVRAKSFKKPWQDQIEDGSREHLRLSRCF
jgi:hypothetical protein